MTKKENIFLRIMESESDMRKIYFQLDLSVRFPAVSIVRKTHKFGLLFTFSIALFKYNPHLFSYIKCPLFLLF